MITEQAQGYTVEVGRDVFRVYSCDFLGGKIEAKMYAEKLLKKLLKQTAA